ncbi:hypothetical protein EHS25_006831 [Saitozyma podzolica]|uniref:D-lactate dehydratase n=1 Tax=Saitozyma podzolica TaxID=1890683 RepID=A0A427XRL3_9TREE|nr:hypothetical protein EHS25_006831 [Saitozyma podzolica]
MTQPVLFIFTSADKLLDAYWVVPPEAAHPFYVLREHFPIVAASTKGGKVPVDQVSVDMFTDDDSQRFLKDKDAIELVQNTKKISEIKADDYAAIFVVGGHGPMIDLATDKTFAKLVEDFYAKKKSALQPVSAVCHGPAALLSAVKPGTSEPLVKGVTVTGFSNDEEKQAPVDADKALPYWLETKMKELGATYVKADEPWGVKVVWDQGILTGENPASAGPLGEKLRDILLGKA